MKSVKSVKSADELFSGVSFVATTGVESLPQRMLCWIDGVGGYLICLGEHVRIGQATADADIEIAIYADISRQHATLSRDSEGFVIEAWKPTLVNDKAVEKAILRDGDQLGLGNRCRVMFHQPVPISPTARLEILSGHRLPLSVDGVVLMADTCIFGPSTGAHVIIPDLRQPVVLYRRGEGLAARSAGELIVDGQPWRDRAVLTPGSTIAGEDFQITLEPLAARIGKVKV